MKGPVEILACQSSSDARQFERTAEVLHGSNPAFVPPFPGSVAKYLSEKSPFHQRHGRIHAFLALRDGRPVGRIAAIINRSHNERYGDRTGFFGFFECENDPDTSRALFERAFEVLRSEGRDSVRGPYNPSINDECGLLASAFDEPPFIGLTWNPPYYKELVEQAGFAVVRVLHSLNLPMHRLPEPERLAKIVRHMTRRSPLTMRVMDFSRLDEELAVVREVYNATLERNWGFVPISQQDLSAAAADIRAIADPKLLLIAELDGQSAGVALTLPNFNEILIRTKSVPHWLRLPWILWLMKTQRITSCRQSVLGVVPSCRDRGLHAWLIHEQFMRARERYANATLGWIEENNTEILKNCELVGGERDRSWELFERPLNP
ncbi:MAG: hypothetical protein SFU53_07405 [Terrimicrobiaceae bacterium]|nr:hypothetical protein [Terrimicrobiaceae bacterium]